MFRPASSICLLTVFLNLSDMSFYRLPSLYLALILFRQAPTHIITAIPLEPSAGIVGMYPSFLSPKRKRLARVYTEIIQFWIMFFWTELDFCIPGSGKLLLAISHVFPAKNSHLKHLFRGKLRLKFRVEVFTGRLRQIITVIPLHFIINNYSLFHISWRVCRAFNWAATCCLIVPIGLSFSKNLESCPIIVYSCICER